MSNTDYGARSTVFGGLVACAEWRSLQIPVINQRRYADYPGTCTQYSVLSTPYSVLRTQYSVLSTPYSVLRTQYSVLVIPRRPNNRHSSAPAAARSPAEPRQASPALAVQRVPP